MFRDPPVILGGPKTGLDMRQGNAEFRCSQRSSQSGIRVTDDHHPVWLLSKHHRFQVNEHLPSLAAMRCGTDSQVHIRLGDTQFPEESLGQFVVIMLARMHKKLTMTCFSKSPAQWFSFNELWPSPNNSK